MANDQPERIKLAIWFSITADLRFLSHRDTVRLWQRTLRRAQLPTRYSSGFNPHMRLTLPVPRSVGLACRSELLIVELDKPLVVECDRPCDQDGLTERLNRLLPTDMKVLKQKTLPGKFPINCLEAQYRLALAAGVDRHALTERIEQIISAASWPVERPARPGHKARTIDLKASLAQLTLDGDNVFCTIDIGPRGTVRLDELLNALGINDPQIVTETERIDSRYQPSLEQTN